MSSQQNSISRRALVTQLGAGVRGTIFAAALPPEGQVGGNTAAPFVDPTTKYPKLPILDNRNRGRDWLAK